MAWAHSADPGLMPEQVATLRVLANMSIDGFPFRGSYDLGVQVRDLLKITAPPNPDGAQK